ncbi:MAG: YmfQ family protein [Treponema sp.]|jgi:hypothetical protein|nr:YmfQ family protein [Treponema sp.]
MGVAGIETYGNAVRKLFPQGEYWDRQFADAESGASLFLQAKLDEFVRFRSRMDALKAESVIETADELIAEWERVLLGTVTAGLPLNERRRRLKSKREAKLNRTELDKTAAMYGFSIVSVTFSYRTGFFAHGALGQQRLCGFHAFSTLRITAAKEGLAEECAGALTAGWPACGAGRIRCGQDRLTCYPVLEDKANDLFLMNYVIQEKRLSGGFEEAVKGKLFASQTVYFWYEGV